jgi:TPR repeat protein
MHTNGRRRLQAVARSLVLAASFLMSGCFGGDVPLMANMGLEIPSDEIEPLEMEALRGSGAAALKLFNYYDVIVVDREKSLHWAAVAAENDDPGGMYSLGFGLAQTKDKKSRVRARYWLEKAAKNGEPLAKSLLKELPEQ